MSAWPIAGDRLEMDATGVVNPSPVFEQDAASGRWTNTGRQAQNEQGVPLWEVGVSWLGADRYGNVTETSLIVTVPSRTMPAVERHESVAFEGLTLDAYAPRNGGGLRESLTASGIVDAD